MNAKVNEVIGTVVYPPRTSMTERGKRTRFKVGVTRPNGEKADVLDFVVFGEYAERAEAYLRAGDRIGIDREVIDESGMSDGPMECQRFRFYPQGGSGAFAADDYPF